MKKTFEVLNRLVDEGVLGRYAVGGAMAAMFYTEPGMTEELWHALEAKRERRQALARLSYGEKVKILIELQSLAAPILRARGKKAVVFRA